MQKRESEENQTSCSNKKLDLLLLALKVEEKGRKPRNRSSLQNLEKARKFTPLEPLERSSVLLTP